jgi:succinate dehydrogenase / fumarate reductase cytochrome b subunit
MAQTPRPVFRNIHVSQIVSYRLPPAGIVSILHRISGALMFLLMPFIIWLFDTSLSSEVSYERFTAAFTTGIGGPAGLCSSSWWPWR